MRPGGISGDSAFLQQALIYGSEQEFLAGALPFVQEGMDLGEPVLAVVRGANVEALRSELGPDPPGVRLLSVEEWYETSARTREKFAGWVTDHSDGGRVRVIGEPPWEVGHEAQVRDWARHESVLNVAFDGFPLRFICPYDARILPAEILDHAEHTHPEIVDGQGRVTGSPRYEDPHIFCAGL